MKNFRFTSSFNEESNGKQRFVNLLTEKLYAKEEGLQEGLNKGRAEGREEGFREVAVNLKKAGADLAMISQATGLTIEQIKELQ